MDSVNSLNNNTLNSYIDQLKTVTPNRETQQTGGQKPANNSDSVKARPSDIVSVSDEANPGEAPQGPANNESDKGVTALLGAWQDMGDPSAAFNAGECPPHAGEPGLDEQPAIQWTPISDNASSAPATGLEAPVGQRSSASGMMVWFV